ncbi:MAG: hypothetical protein ACOX9C_07640 [Kiritimatiellia bacterium]
MSPTSASAPSGSDLGEIFADPAGWTGTAEDFAANRRDIGFRILDPGRAAISTDRRNLRLFGLEVCEARVYFEGEAVTRVEISVYNKGDAGSRTQAEFEVLVESVREKLAAFAKDPGAAVRVANRRANYIVQRHQWVKSSPPIQLEWACVMPHRSRGVNVPYNAEYINVLLVPVRAARTMASATGGASAMALGAARRLTDNIRRTPEGDVWVDGVPMVDQGQKGYCAAATSERVLRYYGLNVDQHQIAQLAKTAAESGTSIEGMVNAIGLVGRTFQLDKRDLIPSTYRGGFKGSPHEKLINQYNNAAKRAKKPTIDWQQYTVDRAVNLPAIWNAMDPEILLEARASQKQNLAQFEKDIRNYVGQGVPLLWSCLVGMYPEEPPLGAQGAFGHIRMIIGYNDRTDEILYSDTWGPNHALKRMPKLQAWAMTKGLFVLKPRNVR